MQHHNIKERKDELHGGEGWWEKTFNSFTDIVTLQDASLRILKVNKYGCEILNTSSSDLIGRYCYELFHGSNSPCFGCPLLDAKSNSQSYTREIHHEKLGKSFLVSAAPILDKDGNVEFIAHVAKDISTWKEAEKEKDKLKAQLLHSQKLESVGRIASGIAHEINTPIQYVATNVSFLEESFVGLSNLFQLYEELLIAAENDGIEKNILHRIKKCLEQLDWTFLKEEIPTAISQTKEGVDRVTSIVRAMKEFSHPGSSDKEPANLNTIVETTVTVARNEWKYVAEVVTDLDPDLPTVNCLGNEIGQVILNILINAAHAIAEKRRDTGQTAKGTILIATRYDTKWVELRISDTGSGMPTEIIGQIFDPFFTTKDVGKGTGQGLAIAHDVVVRKHGGTIDVASEPCKGSVFTIKLPTTTPY